jgi:hypothetical protein
MTPETLLHTFKADEILDLMAYLLPGGDRKQRMFLPWRGSLRASVSSD